MDGVPITRASQLVQIARAVEDHGSSARLLLARMGWPGWYLEEPETPIPTPHIWRYMQMAVRAVGDPALGHKVDPLRALSILGPQLLAAPTLQDSLRTLCARLDLVTSNTCGWLAEGGDGYVWLCTKSIVYDAALPEMEQYFLMQFIRVVRLSAGPDWNPKIVRLQSGRIPDLERTPLLSEAEIRYGEKVTAIAVPRAMLPRPLRLEDRALKPPAAAPDHVLPRADDLVGTIRKLVRCWLPHGPPAIQLVAKAAGVEVRTLQRRLALDGVVFRDLVGRARLEAAIDLMENGGASISDIAFDLGYTDVAHFTRAFRRWTGVTPRAYRNDLLSGRAARWAIEEPELRP